MGKPCQCYQFPACPSVPKSQIIRWLLMQVLSWAHISFIELLSWQLAWGSVLWEWGFGWGRRENSSGTRDSGDMSLKGMAGGLGTSLVAQEEAASGKPLRQGERERKKKRPGRWQWGQIGGCHKQASPTWRVCVGLAFISFTPKLLVVG